MKHKTYKVKTKMNKKLIMYCKNERYKEKKHANMKLIEQLCLLLNFNKLFM